MSCGCKTPKYCEKCRPYKVDKCFDIEEEGCISPCKDGVTDTDCVFYNSGNQTGKQLPNLNIKSASSLSLILKKIDSYFGNSGVVNLSQLNWYTLNPDDIPVIKLFDALQHILFILQAHKTQLLGIENDIEGLNESVQELGEEIDNLNHPEISDVELEISSSDNLHTVIEKIISYVKSIECDCSGDGYEFPVSTLPDNQLQLDPSDKWYVPAPNTESILNQICNDDTGDLISKFSTLVNKVGLKHIFHVSNSGATSVTVQYINTNGQDGSSNISPGGSGTISNVRKIVTLPSSVLRITYLGNE